MSVSTLSGRLQAAVQLNSTLLAANRPSSRTQDDSDSLSIGNQITLALGTGANQGNTYFYDSRTLSASANESLNVSGGSHGGAIALEDPYGQTTTFARIIGVLIINTSTTGTLLVGGDATDNITTMFGDNTDAIRIRPGGQFLLTAGDATSFAVAANEILKLANEDGANPLTYQIVIIGN